MTELRVEPGGIEHLSAVRATYEHARQLQRERSGVSWPHFSDAAILAELTAGHLQRVLDGDALAGVFTVLHEDPIIWETLERNAHLYLHRIARAPTYEGHALVDAVFAWARARCRALGREGLRVDTWADNDALTAYYVRHGFRIVGTRRLFDARLPEHYYGVELVLLEERLGSSRD